MYTFFNKVPEPPRAHESQGKKCGVTVRDKYERQGCIDKKNSPMSRHAQTYVAIMLHLENRGEAGVET
jgi:hypothetical protein